MEPDFRGDQGLGDQTGERVLVGTQSRRDRRMNAWIVTEKTLVQG